MEIQPLRNNVLVKLFSLSNQKYKNLIHIPDSSMGKNSLYYGIVEAIGNGRRTKKGARPKIDLNLGDLVVFARHNGTRLMVDNTEYREILAHDILAVLNEE